MVFDLLDYVAEEEKEGMLLFCDWEKAYDSLNWSYLKTVLQRFNFGPNFLRWVDLIYPSSNSDGPTAQLQINGQLSEPYKILRGLRQGCPLSCNLFLLGIEPMLQNVREDSDIVGIYAGNTHIKVSAYADDTLFVLNGTPSSLRRTVQCLDIFYEVSGLKLNKRKTQAVWIGKSRNKKEGICPELNLGWAFCAVKYLGVSVDPSRRDNINMNYSQKIDKLKKRLNPWLSYGLTPFGKVHVLKSEALSQLVYLMSILPKPSVHQTKQLETIMFNFIWGKTEKIRRSTMKNLKKDGGLQVPDVSSQADSLKISWVKKFLDPRCTSPWKDLVSAKLVISPGITIFHCDGDQKLVDRRLKSAFWGEVAASWFKLTDNNKPSSHQILSKPIWYNKHIRINVPVDRKRLIAKGVIQIKDIYDSSERRLLNAKELHTRFKVSNFLVWNSLLQAIPKPWKHSLETERPINEEMPGHFSDIKSIKKCAQWAYPTLLRSVPVTVPEKAFGKWQMELDISLSDVWSDIFKNVYAFTSDFKLRWLQLRIVHRIIPTNSRLCLYGIRSSDKCDRCPNIRESVLHLFWLCPVVLRFWAQLSRTLGLKEPLSAPSVMLGLSLGCKRIPEHQLHICTLLGKWYIWRCRYREAIPTAEDFTRACMDYIRVERYFAVVSNSMSKFNHNWGQLYEIIKNSKHPP